MKTKFCTSHLTREAQPAKSARPRRHSSASPALFIRNQPVLFRVQTARLVGHLTGLTALLSGRRGRCAPLRSAPLCSNASLARSERCPLRLRPSSDCRHSGFAFKIKPRRATFGKRAERVGLQNKGRMLHALSGLEKS